MMTVKAITDKAPWQSASIWRAPAWRHLPGLAALSLITAVAACAMAFAILSAADGKPIDTWAITPSVLLSILATVVGALVRTAFHSSAELYWWTRLLSEPGVTLRELQSTWEFASSTTSLFMPSHSWNLARSAGVFVLILAATGPLLQRSTTDELAIHVSWREMVLPIRVEPMWNVTVEATGGFTWSTRIYQKEFAQLAFDHTQHNPPKLRNGLCEGSCTGNITLAGFARDCTEEAVATSDEIDFIGPALHIVLWDRFDPTFNDTTYLVSCVNGTKTHETIHKFCRNFVTYYQLAVDTGEEKGTPKLRYKSYVRTNADKDLLTIQSCTFSTAFVTLPLLINDTGSFIAQDSQHSKTVLEDIPGPTLEQQADFLAGFMELMRGLFEGYLIFDKNELSNVISGVAPRLYADMGSSRSGSGPDILAVKSPLDDFSSTLDAISLRYALASTPDEDAERVSANEDYIEKRVDARPDGLQALQTPLSKTQTVFMREETLVAVFRAHYEYAAAAMSVVLIASVMVVPLMMGWQRIGRNFSMSPLEIAKAFDAPLLGEVSSNADADTINKAMGDVRVRYGEVRTTTSRDRGEEVAECEEGLTSDIDACGDHELLQFGQQTDRPRLMIRRAREVGVPQNRVIYA